MDGWRRDLRFTISFSKTKWPLLLILVSPPGVKVSSWTQKTSKSREVFKNHCNKDDGMLLHS